MNYIIQFTLIVSLFGVGLHYISRHVTLYNFNLIVAFQANHVSFSCASHLLCIGKAN